MSLRGQDRDDNANNDSPTTKLYIGRIESFPKEAALDHVLASSVSCHYFCCSTGPANIVDIPRDNIIEEKFLFILPLVVVGCIIWFSDHFTWTCVSKLSLVFVSSFLFYCSSMRWLPQDLSGVGFHVINKFSTKKSPSFSLLCSREKREK